MQLGFIPVDKCCEVGVQVPLREALENGQINSTNMQGNGLLVILNALLSGITVSNIPAANGPTIPSGYQVATSSAVNMSDYVAVGQRMISFTVLNNKGDGSAVEFSSAEGGGGFIADGMSISYAAEPGSYLDVSGFILNTTLADCSLLITITLRSA